MGLFGGLFDKKNCAICGGEIGLLGNRKLEDGNLCKNCANQLSPFFSERRHSTVAEIAEQLAYREENRLRAGAFRMTRCYGESWRKIVIDDTMQTFALTNSNNFVRDNPDIIDFAMVRDCVPDIREHRHEATRKDAEGHNVSFNPRRYFYDYDFNVRLVIASPWFDTIDVRLNEHDIMGSDYAECERLICMTEDVVETMTGVRPDLSSFVPYHAPFCMECGRELPPEGGRCLFCFPPIPVPHGGPRPAPMPHAPVPPHAPVHPHAPVPPQAPAPRAPMPQHVPAPQQPAEPPRGGRGVGPAAPAAPQRPAAPAAPQRPSAPAAPQRPSAPAQGGRGAVPQQPPQRGSAPDAGRPGPGGNEPPRRGPRGM